ncbi:MAG: SPASM domain-containing protein [Lachnospiraceae bacterium]|jgi:radical SAM protein with 4Fe4S-binding SPASM domain|nr:SPASM domain-containing protein [Lachnospiraceae bacterium]
MKARIRPKTEIWERQELGKVLPLDTPFRIMIEPAAFCNLNCNFCPHMDTNILKSANVPQGFLDYSLFQKIIDDISVMPSKVRKLGLCGIGEPMLNKNLANMIAYATQKNKFGGIDLFTNGLLLNPETNRALVNAGLTFINISINGLTDVDYLQTCGKKVDVEKMRKNIIDLYEHKGNLRIYIKTVDDGSLSEKSKQRFFEMFGDYCDDIFIENLKAEAWPGIDFPNLKSDALDIFGRKSGVQKICPWPFYYVQITWDGIVLPCCGDWKRSYPIGDLKTKSFSEIWNGEEMKQMRIMQLKGQKHRSALCRDCIKFNVTITDNLDPYAEELLEKYEKL